MKFYVFLWFGWQTLSTEKGIITCEVKQGEVWGIGIKVFVFLLH